MSMVEKEKDLIGFAHKILCFKMSVTKSCKAKGIEPPTDEQISDYINDYGLHFEDFMADFTEHEGMFRCLKTPLEEFKDEIKKMSWRTTPTEDEILSFFNNYGNDVNLFCQHRAIREMNSLERKVYLKTMEALPIEGLVALWNLFIEESSIYGEGSHIYDLANKKDYNFLCERITSDELESINKIIKKGFRYIQWFSVNAIQSKTDDDIKRLIVTFWGEIFKRIMVFPTCYELIGGEQWVINYFEEIVWPIITKEAGIEICTETNEMKYIAKNS